MIPAMNEDDPPRDLLHRLLHRLLQLHHGRHSADAADGVLVVVADHSTILV